MKIIISPAKKMKIDVDSFETTKVHFLKEANLIRSKICSLSYDDAKAMWKCNDSLAELNFERFQNMDLEANLTPAILAYEGLQYQHMSPNVFSNLAIEYIKKHLYILSGFYGILSAFDGVVPYRLEMQAKLVVGNAKDLYEFWGDSLYQHLHSIRNDGVNVIINLASKEYSKIVQKYLKSDDKFVNIEFGELVGDKIQQKGTIAKMARGELVRFMAERQIQDIKAIKEFKELGFAFSPAHSNDLNLVFLK